MKDRTGVSSSVFSRTEYKTHIEYKRAKQRQMAVF